MLLQNPKSTARLPNPNLTRSEPYGASSRKFWGLLKQEERWAISLKGWLAVATITVVMVLIAALEIYPFLAITKRVDTHFLVVEGWVHRYGIRTAVDEFQKGSYQRVFATGGPVIGNGGYVNDQQTSASVGAQSLVRTGIARDVVQMVPSHVIGWDRTYSSAVALRDWLKQHDVTVSGINIVTEAVHARRTRLLFQKAFGDGVEVGIIAVPNPDYDARHWWRYSEGMKDVISEGTAYLYARFFFWPQAAKPREKGVGSLTEQEKEMEVGR